LFQGFSPQDILDSAVLHRKKPEMFLVRKINLRQPF
jgi:hypothetical protein